MLSPRNTTRLPASASASCPDSGATRNGVKITASANRIVNLTDESSRKRRLSHPRWTVSSGRATIGGAAFVVVHATRVHHDSGTATSFLKALETAREPRKRP